MAAGLGFKTFNTGDVLSAADVNGYLMQGVLVFADATARDAAITSPQEGQFAYTKDNNSLWYYSGSAWVSSGATGDIEGVTAGVGISGGGTSGTVTITNSMATAIDAKGDLVVGTGADTFSKLTVGANGTTLVADSAEATGLKWATASSGGMTLISETTASANSAINLSSIPGTYKQLLLTWHGLQFSSTNETSFGIRFNNDSGTNYSYASLFKRAGTAADNNTDDAGTEASMGFFSYSQSTTGTLVNLPNGFLTIDNYASTTKFKNYTYENSFLGNSINYIVGHGSYKSTSAITSIDFYRAYGTATLSNISNTSIRLYGIS